jgi:protein-tyrosine kinase
MERIKLAIEKARSDQAELTKSPIPTLHEVKDAAAKVFNTGRTVSTEAGEASERTVAQYTRTPVVSLDEAHLEQRRVISHQKSNPATWAFDVLRTQVLQKMDENGWRTLAITSPSVGSGKTVVSVNLALSIANQTNRTALLVDFDLRRPSVATTLGLNQKHSLNDVLAGQADIASALVNPGVERFVVLPTNRPMDHASETLSSAKVQSIINELRGRYSDRVVLFDLPPVLAADDVMAVLPRIDCVLLVVGNGISSQSEIEEASNRLSKANLLGVVLNKDEAPAQQAYY